MKFRFCVSWVWISLLRAFNLTFNSTCNKTKMAQLVREKMQQMGSADNIFTSIFNCQLKCEVCYVTLLLVYLSSFLKKYSLYWCVLKLSAKLNICSLSYFLLNYDGFIPKDMAAILKFIFTENSINLTILMLNILIYCSLICLCC